MARLFLLDYYKEQYVIPTAVIELLKDYNPFSTKTGLTKKQVGLLSEQMRSQWVLHVC